MRGLTLWLLLANLSYAAWWVMQPTGGPGATPAALPLEMPALVLLHEMAPATVAPPVELPPAAAPVSAAVVSPLEQPPAIPRCYRLGPWRQAREQALEQARWTVEDQPHPWQDTVTIPKRYWVLAQPAPGQAEALLAQARNQRLKAWVLNQGEWRGRIAFGNFRQQSNAAEKLAAVKAVGVEAELQAETESQPQYWLDVAQTVSQPPSNAPLVACHVTEG